MQEVSLTTDLKIGDDVIDSVSVKSITFMEFCDLWGRAGRQPKTDSAIQRLRVQHQAIFKSGDKRIVPDDQQTRMLPLQLFKEILSKLDHDQGTAGKIIGDGDGSSKPILYKLGTPIGMSSGNVDASIIELEFQAKTYGDVEDILACDTDMSKTVELLRTLAVPVGTPSLMRLPAFALDRITVADGIQIMFHITPRF